MTAANLDPKTVDMILELTREAPEAQLHDVDAMDTKSIQVFAAASVIMGLASFARDFGSWPTTVLFGFGLAAYAFCAAASILALRIRTFSRPVPADKLWPEYWDATPDELKHAVVKNISDAYKANAELIDKKSANSQYAIYAMGLQSFLIGLGLVMARLVN